MRLAPRGFTLVELLVTTSLMAVVGGVMVSALGGGIRVWERAREFGTHRQSALIAFNRLQRDLHNVRRFRLVPFDGAYDRFTFAAVERTNPDSEDPAVLGRLGYVLDERRHLLCRSFTPYPLARRQRVSDHCQSVLEGVERVRFSYCGPSAEGGTTGWSGRWDAGELPAAVKVEVSIKTGREPASSHSWVVYLGASEPPSP